MSPSFNCVAILCDNTSRARALSQAFVDRGLTVRAFDSVDALLAPSSLEGVGCVIADALPSSAATALAQKIQDRGDPPPLILLSESDDALHIARGMKNGLFDVLDRNGSDSELFRNTTVALYHEGQTRELRQRAQQARQLLSKLSNRERQVLDLVVSAKSNKEISSELKLSPRTVENHRARILRKLQADSAMHLLRITLEARGIPLELG